MHHFRAAEFENFPASGKMRVLYYVLHGFSVLGRKTNQPTTTLICVSISCCHWGGVPACFILLLKSFNSTQLFLLTWNSYCIQTPLTFLDVHKSKRGNRFSNCAPNSVLSLSFLRIITEKGVWQVNNQTHISIEGNMVFQGIWWHKNWNLNRGNKS